jgi:ABC-type transport system involved in Fe-S cluster assembly fused permease/ATPase subunit
MFGKNDATMDEIVAAATAANAHNFIRQLPDGYETKVCYCGLSKDPNYMHAFR